MVIGYFGIVVPARDFYQGFYLDSRLRSRAETSLAALRALPDLRRVVVKHPLSGVADADQGLLGGLCSGAVDTALRGDGKVAIFGMCISAIIQSNYFWIKGGRSAEDTTIERMVVPFVDMARLVFSDLPEVKAIDQRREKP